MTQRNRRNDIQALRALAIGLVLAVHAVLPGFQGGFIGVDVFFVLSGFLITGLVLHEAESTGHFNGWLFYARRGKRLVPALLVLLLVTEFMAWFIAAPLAQIEAANAGRAAALWASNFWFVSQVINYFSSGFGSNLFLHTWSLAVEEQFYLVWPWLVLLCYGFWGKGMNRRRLIAGLGVTGIGSFALSVYWSQTDVNAGFYMMGSRAWEFALGGLLLLLRESAIAGRLAWIAHWQGRSILNLAGLAMILIAAVAYGANLRYPGAWALLPCLGAGLILLDAPERNPDSPVSRAMLQARPIQFLGDISYSLYLWHWPVLILGVHVLGNTPATRAGLVLTSILFASASYYWLERPIHKAPLHSAKNVLVPALGGMAAVALAMGIWANSSQILLHQQSRIQAASGDLPIVYQHDCDDWYHNSRVTACIFGPQNAKHTIVMLGDSVLLQWFPAIEQIYLKNPDWRVMVLTKSSCPAAEVSFYYEAIKAEYTVCDAWRKRAVKYIARIRPDVVLMGSSHYDFTANQWVTGTRSILSRLGDAAGTILIVNPTPIVKFDGAQCLAAEANRPSWMRDAARCTSTPDPGSRERLLSVLRQAAAPYPNARVIDLDDIVCPHELCQAQRGTTIVYRDTHHLTASFVRSLTPAVAKILRKAHAPL